VSRPREFDTDVALDAAKNAFWDRGYEATSLADVEATTGLSRSSLYQAFGSKRGLFDAALDRYRVQNLDPVLAGLEQPGAGLPELRAYLATLAAAFRDDPVLAARGCLVVNTMTELGSHDARARAAALAYHERITAALANGLRGAASDRLARAQAGARARTLTASVIGALVLAHLDPGAAADLCDQLAADLGAAR